MSFLDLLTAETICIDSHSRSKTAVLLTVSKLLSQNYPPLNMDALFDAYWKREHLGSTTIGHGIMIPHIRTDAIDQIGGCFIKLQNPVDFGAEDKQPIDLVFGLIVADHQINEHLHLLSTIIKQVSAPEFRLACRKAPDHTSLCALFNVHTPHTLHQSTEMVD